MTRSEKGDPPIPPGTAAGDLPRALETLVLEQMPAVIWATDEKLRFTASTGAGLRQLGLRPGQVVGLSLYEFFATDDPAFPSIAAHVRALTGVAQEYEATWSGREYTSHIEPLRAASGAIVGTVGLATDVTDRRKLEETLRQAQKMEAVGRLAGGVAHDFNNLLTIINGSAERLATSAAAQGLDVTEVQDILLAGQRAGLLTRQLLAFSRKQRLDAKLTALDRLIEDSCRLMQPLLGERVALAFSPGAAGAFVRVDATQFTQVIMNLVINARDAMVESGVIRVETAVLELPGGPPGAPPPPSAGSYVRMTVSDTGPGIDPLVLPHVFDPFFTTKPHGTGLGLATVHGVIEQSGGHVTVESTPGSGACFRVYLPLGEVPKTKTTESPVPAAVARDGCEVILVVEDEGVVRSLVQRTLRDRGYVVHTAESGEAALALVEENGASFDLVLSDVVLKGLTGPALVERLRQLRPGLKALLMSGYSQEALRAVGTSRDLPPLIEKPFSLESLARMIREILDAPAPRS